MWTCPACINSDGFQTSKCRKHMCQVITDELAYYWPHFDGFAHPLPLSFHVHDIFSAWHGGQICWLKDWLTPLPFTFTWYFLDTFFMISFHPGMVARFSKYQPTLPARWIGWSPSNFQFQISILIRFQFQFPISIEPTLAARWIGWSPSESQAVKGGLLSSRRLRSSCFFTHHISLWLVSYLSYCLAT